MGDCWVGWWVGIWAKWRSVWGDVWVYRVVGWLGYVLSGVVDVWVGVCVCGWLGGVVDALTGVRMGRKR